MKNIKGLFVAAAVASLMASKVVRADDTAAPAAGEVKQEKPGCDGKNGCPEKKPGKGKGKKDKNHCKEGNHCSKEKKAETK